LNIKILIIGIGGISRSGKTKLAKRLRTYFKKQGYKPILLSTDSFFFCSKKLPTIKNYLNREIPEAINFAQLIQQITVSKSSTNTIIIIEGHLVFANPQLCELLDCRIFFIINKATFIERKMKDSRWEKVSPEYIQYAWQAWLQYGQINDNKPHLRLDGNRKLPFNWVIDYIYEHEKKLR